MTKVFSILLSLLLTIGFIFLAYVAYESYLQNPLNNKNTIEFVSDVILLPGLLPLIAINFFLLHDSSPKNIIYAIILVPILALLHAIVFAILAHAPSIFYYWIAQAFEVVILVAIVFRGLFYKSKKTD